MEIQEIKDTIQSIQETIETDEFKKLKNDRVLFMYELYQKYPEFGANYPSLMRKVALKEPLDFLNTMFENLEKIKNKTTTVKEAETKMGMELAQKYCRKK